MRQFIGSIVRRHPEGVTISMVVLISLAFAVITQGSWLSVGNMQSVSQLTAVLAVMAFGEAIVIATGEIDISVGSVSGIGALAFLGLAPVVGSGLALLGALACGILIGAMNGVFVALLGLPSLLVTLGTLFLFQGVGYAVTSGFSFAATDSVRQQWIYNAVGNSGVAGVNAGVIWALVVLVVLQLVVFETPVGNRILAVGGDAASSFSRGVNVTKINFSDRYTLRRLCPPRHPEFSYPARRPTPMVHSRCRAHCCAREPSGSNFDEICNQTMRCENNDQSDRSPSFCGSPAYDSRNVRVPQIFSRWFVQKLMTSLINFRQNSRKKWKRTTHPRH